MEEGSSLLHPETMTYDELLQLLRKRHIQPEPHLDKYQLVELFYAYVLPLPQRKHRANRTGKLLAQSQKLLDKTKQRVTFSSTRLIHPVSPNKRKSTEDDDLQVKKQGLINSPIATDNSEATASRLKPAINFERKTIKLGSGSGIGLPSRTETHVQASKHDVNLSTYKEGDSAQKKIKMKITWP